MIKNWVMTYSYLFLRELWKVIPTQNGTNYKLPIKKKIWNTTDGKKHETTRLEFRQEE